MAKLEIKAPYNFVPIAEKCYFPEWANCISHDIPFSDGVSGSIDIKITAETPIYVRNGSSDPAEKSFSQNSAGRYFIPGTSIKGEIRNVLEILSFGKMTQVQDMRFGIRTFERGSGYSDKLRKVQCGWLCKDIRNEKYELEICGEPYRVTDIEIDRFFKTPLASFCGTMVYEPKYEIEGKKCKIEDIKKDDYIKTASVKYEIFGSKTIQVNFRPEEKKGDKYNKRICIIDQNSNSKGSLIFTGQSSKRYWDRKGERGNGKQYEFVFPEEIKKTVTVPNEIIEDFKYIHRENYDYLNLWREDLESGEYAIPVFFTMTGNDINAIGLTYMFKYPSNHHVYSAIPEELLSLRRKDLAECIFGYTSNDKSLKTRVFFKHAFLNGGARELDLRKEVLASPKPSFSGTYLENATWNNSGGVRISGRKRYPVRNRVVSGTLGNGNNETTFVPLDRGAVFCERIIFHNLRPVELGALLSAITFHGREECFHSIGMAKPLGYGKVKIEVENLRTDSEKSLDDFLNDFVSVMERFTPGWQTNRSLKELFAMAKGIEDKDSGKFKYLVLGIDNKNNEFADVSKENQSLPRFTEISAGKLPGRYVSNPVFSYPRERFDANRLEDIELEIEQEELRCKQTELSRQEYESLINDARKLIDSISLVGDDRLSEAERLINEAVGIYPEGKSHSPLMNSIQEERNRIHKEKEEIARQMRKKERAEAGLSVLAETYPGDPTKYKVNNLKMLLSIVQRYIKDVNSEGHNQITYVPEYQYDILREQTVRILRSLKPRDLKAAIEGEKKYPELLQVLKKIVMEEDAVRMFEEIKEQI